MQNEITINGVTYVKKEQTEPINTVMIIPEMRLEWGRSSDEKMNWHEAKKWCEEQGEGWRLPNRFELYCALEKNIDGFSSGFNWSRTEYSDCAWMVYFNNGDNDGDVDYENKKMDKHFFRCVRNI